MRARHAADMSGHHLPAILPEREIPCVHECQTFKCLTNEN
jgi:hypothetical protein